jgi:hypothetical protein
MVGYLTDDELEQVWKGIVVAYFKVQKILNMNSRPSGNPNKQVGRPTHDHFVLHDSQLTSPGTEWEGP